MNIATQKLPNVRKTQMLDANLVSDDMKNLTQTLGKARYGDLEDYICSVNLIVDYLENDKFSPSNKRDILERAAPIAAAINLNNSKYVVTHEDREQIIEAYANEEIKIEYSEKYGWLPILASGYDIFFVADCYKQ